MKQGILVIEDNPINMELVTDVLHLAGYAVFQAVDAEQGIALAKAAKPAVILMDLSLPGLDGLAATKLLKLDPETEGIPVVALTANAMKGDMEKAIEAGCDGYLTKPVRTSELPFAVAKFIDIATV